MIMQARLEYRGPPNFPRPSDCSADLIDPARASFE
jgi:hypothetical protein